MSKGGRFGKYGEAKRLDRMREKRKSLNKMTKPPVQGKTPKPPRKYEKA